MATKKIALIGCKQGPWISTRHMVRPMVHVLGEPGVELLVAGVDSEDPHNQTGWMQRIVGPGQHRLMTAKWMCVSVVSGDHQKVQVVLVEKREAA